MSAGSMNARELATVLAALRYWQREGKHSDGAEQDIATEQGTLIRLSATEIDRLCERLNTNEDETNAELRQWLHTLEPGHVVCVDDGGLALVAVPPGRFAPINAGDDGIPYLELGGVPLKEDDEG